MENAEQRSSVLSLNLSLPQGSQEYVVDNIEVQGTDMRHRINAIQGDHSICAVLIDDFVSYLRGLLARLTAQTMVYSDVEASFRTDKLSLGNVQIVSLIRQSKSKGVVVRFMEILGDVQSILKNVVSPAQAETHSIAVEAIERVVGRTYDVACVYEKMPTFSQPWPGFVKCAKSITNNQKELLFRLDLLQRAVDEKQRAANSPQSPDVQMAPV